MTNTNRFPQISPRVLNALDRDFPGWQDLVPTERDSSLNEDSLITLIKSRKRAEIYREVSDKRKVMWAEMLGDSEKSAPDLIHEFAIFNWERMNTWASTEKKLSTIALEFTAKSEPVDVEGIGKGLDEVVQKTGTNMGNSVNQFNNSMDTYYVGFFNADVNGVSRAGSDELKGYLKGTFMNNFKSDNRKIVDEQKKCLDKYVTLVKGKLEKMKTGELPPDAIDRSDFFTDEEVQEINKSRAQVITNAFQQRKNSNVNSINEMAQKFMGVSGKEGILNKLNECPEHIITEEVKNAISEAFDKGCILPDTTDNPSGRSRRDIASGISFILDYAALEISKLGDKNVSKEIEEMDPVYKFCNSGTYFTAHIFTFGFCTGWTAGANVIRAAQGKPVDWGGIANVLSGISFLIGLCSTAGWVKMLRKVVLPAAAGVACQAAEEVTKLERLSSSCAASLLIVKSFTDLNFALPGVIMTTMSVVATGLTSEAVRSAPKQDLNNKKSKVG